MTVPIDDGQNDSRSGPPCPMHLVQLNTLCPTEYIEPNWLCITCKANSDERHGILGNAQGILEDHWLLPSLARLCPT